MQHEIKPQSETMSTYNQFYEINVLIHVLNLGKGVYKCYVCQSWIDIINVNI